MTDPKTPAIEPRGPLSEAERHAYAEMERTGHRSVSAIGTVFKLDTALRAALKDRDEARRERDIITKDAGGGYMHRKLTAQIKELRAKLDTAKEGLRNAVEWLGKHQKPLSLNEAKECFENEKRCKEALAKLEEKS